MTVKAENSLTGLLFTDPHFTPSAEFSQPTKDGLTTYLNRCIDSFSWIETLVEKYRPDFVGCLGDVTETTGYVDSTTLKVATGAFDDLANRVVSVGGVLYVMTGNHDTYSTLHNIHNLEFLRHIKGLELVDKPKFYEKHQFYAIPWVENLDEVEIDKRAAFVLTHIDVEGGFLHKTKKADFGVKPEDFAEVPVFNGHQHNPQLIGKSFQNIGALLSRSFHDVDSPARGVSIIRITNRDTPIVTWTHIDNPHDIPFKDIVISDDITAAKWKKKLDEGETGYETCHVRIKYKPEYKNVAEQIGYLTCGARTEPIPDESKIEITSESPKPLSAKEIFTEYLNLSPMAEKLYESIKKKGKEYLDLASRDEVVHSLPIEFEYVEIQQFQSIGHIVLDLSSNGLWFVGGVNEDEPYDANGVGKSSLHEAIFWCLTDKSLRGYTGDEVIHWDHDWCKVEIGLKVGDKRYKIRKTRKHPEWKTSTNIRVEDGDKWKDISARRKTDTKDIVKTLLGRSNNVLQHSVFLTAGLANRFTALSYPARIKLIEEITDAEVYGRAYKLIKADADKGLGELHFARGAISEKKEAIAKAEKDLKDVETRFAEHVKVSESRLAELKASLVSVDEEATRAKVKVEQSENALQKVREKFDIVESKSKVLGEEHRNLLKAAAVAEAEFESRKQQLELYKSRIEDGKCPDCGQAIGKTSHYVTELPKLTEELEESNKRRTETANAATKLEVRINMLAQKSLDINLNEISELEDTISTNNSLLGKANKTKNFIIDEIRKERNKLSNLKTEKKTFISIIDSAKAELEEKQKELETLESEQEQLSWLEDAFHTTGIRAHLLFQHTLPFLNSRLMKHSVEMGQPCILHWKENKRGEFEDKIDVAFDSKRTYKGASKGEKMMVDLSVQCAFNDLAIATGGSHINLLVADEVLDHLDETSVMNFIRILSEKSKNMRILLMAHRPFVGGGLFDHKLMLYKKYGTTDIQRVA